MNKPKVWRGKIETKISAPAEIAHDQLEPVDNIFRRGRFGFAGDEGLDLAGLKEDEGGRERMRGESGVPVGSTADVKNSIHS